MKSIFKIRFLLAIGFCTALLSVAAVPVLAITYGTGDYGECLYSASSTNCDISITNNSFTLDLTITPTVAGSCTIQSDQVTVSTYDPAGYTLTLGSDETNAGLVQGANSIPSTSGTPASPIALSDTWGYRVDSYSSFGAGPTTAETNAALNNSILFGRLQPSNLTADTIANTSSLNTSVPTTVWYGLCLDTSLSIPQGLYSTTVLYTATAN